VVAGGGSVGFSGDGGPANQATVYFPSGVAVDQRGNLYFADQGQQSRAQSGYQRNHHNVCRHGLGGFSGDGGPATSAKLGLT